MNATAEMSPAMVSPAMAGAVETSVAVAIADPQLRSQALAALGAIPSATLAGHCHATTLNELIAATGRLKPGIVLLGLAGLPEDPAVVLSHLSGLDPAPRVVAINDCAEPELILKVMRAGAAEFVYPPLEARFDDAVRRAIADCGRLAATKRTAGAIIGFVSAKGGCGATTLACHSSSYLSLSKKEVLLADLDLSAGIAGLLMQANAAYSLGDAIQNLHRMDHKLWKALVAASPSGVDVMPASPDSSADWIPLSRGLPQMLRFWRMQYEFTMVDLGHGLTPSLLGALESIDTLVLVATNELPALRQARQMIQSLARHNFGGNRLKLVLNRMPKRPQIQLPELQTVMGHSIFCALPDDSQTLTEAYAESRLARFDSGFGKRMADLAATLAGIAPVAAKSRKYFWSRQEK